MTDKMIPLSFKKLLDRIFREYEQNKTIFGIHHQQFYHKKNDSLALAETHFLNCDSLSRLVDEGEESGFLVNSVLYLGEINDLIGNREKAILYYEEVLDLDEFKESYEKAEKHLETPYKK